MNFDNAQKKFPTKDFFSRKIHGKNSAGNRKIIKTFVQVFRRGTKTELPSRNPEEKNKGKVSQRKKKKALGRERRGPSRSQTENFANLEETSKQILLTQQQPFDATTNDSLAGYAYYQ